MSNPTLSRFAPIPSSASVARSIIVAVADMIASDDCTVELTTFSLGSCLGVTLYDPVKKVGGLLHFMLPASKINPARALRQPHMFADTGVPLLFEAVRRLGAEKERLVVKVAGGAQFLDEQKIFNIGERNIEALGQLLSENGVVITAQDLGGMTSRTMRMELATGRITIHSPMKDAYFL